MAVSPLDPQSVRLTIASAVANTLFMVSQLLLANGQRKRVEYYILPLNSGKLVYCTIAYVATKQLISLISFGGGITDLLTTGCLHRAKPSCMFQL